jgi:hypothetical protein
MPPYTQQGVIGGVFQVNLHCLLLAIGMDLNGLLVIGDYLDNVIHFHFFQSPYFLVVARGSAVFVVGDLLVPCYWTLFEGG